MAPRRRAVGADPPTVDVDGNAGGHVLGLVRVVGVGLDLGEDEHLRSIPAVHADTPVFSPIDVEHSRGGEALFSDLTNAIAVVVRPAAPFATLVEPLVARTLRVSRRALRLDA